MTHPAFHPGSQLTIVCLLLAPTWGLSPPVAAATGEGGSVRLRLTVTTPLEYANTPLDPRIDFTGWIRRAQARGVFDPNSLEVRSVLTGRRVRHVVSEDFAYSDQGRVEFVVADPQDRVFEIRFSTAPIRPPLRPQPVMPQIGVGDLLRYNAGRARPINVSYSAGLEDLNNDGRLDLTGCWNYAHRPGWPWDGVFCFPRLPAERLEFGPLARLRYTAAGQAEPSFFSHVYMCVDFADFNRDGRLDLVTTRRGENSASFYLNTGRRELSGLPKFEAAGSVEIAAWEACCAVDLDGDAAIDLVVDGVYVRNENAGGWPFRPAEPVRLNAGRKPCFLDVDGDHRLDAVCLQGGSTPQPNFYRLAWRRNLGGAKPEFGDELLLKGVDLAEISQVTSWQSTADAGLIVQHGAFQELSCFRLQAKRVVRRCPDRPSGSTEQLACSPSAAGLNRQPLASSVAVECSPQTSGAAPDPASSVQRAVLPIGRAESPTAVLSLGDQAWPCLCDWDDDGDFDLLVGGGHGWPRIVINEGTRQRPVFREAVRILSAGQPIRFVRNEILGQPANWHNMGYPLPDFVDWDGDGLRDLVCPNETNRIFWFKNVGNSKQPVFGRRQQILCDGFPDSKMLKSQSNRRANDPQSNNGVYPLEPERPFMWRTGAAFADFTGDGLTDLVTHDGQRRLATLFVQYRGPADALRLRRDQALKLADGRQINDALVDRRAHWTESFRAVDWNADGLQDLLYNVAGAHHGTQDGGSIYLLLNVGTATDPSFAAPRTMRCFGEPIRITNHGPHAWPGDFDGDGKPDLVTCVEWSVYPYYSHAALMMDERPQYRLELLDPQPAAARPR